MIEALLNLGLLLIPSPHILVKAPPTLMEAPLPERQNYGSWSYEANPEIDGFEILLLGLKEDFQAPLPIEYIESIGEERLAMRGYIQFTVDGYFMGPFPFGAVNKQTSELSQPAYNTHYFYTYEGSPSYQYENFDLIWDLVRNPVTGVESEQMLLSEMTECETGLCNKKYLFKRPTN